MQPFEDNGAVAEDLVGRYSHFNGLVKPPLPKSSPGEWETLENQLFEREFIPEHRRRLRVGLLDDLEIPEKRINPCTIYLLTFCSPLL